MDSSTKHRIAPTTRELFDAKAHIAQQMRNPFRRPERCRQFDALRVDLAEGRQHLFRANGTENRRNNIGEAFWRGFHGERFLWDVAAPLYVAYRAGVAAARAIGATRA